MSDLTSAHGEQGRQSAAPAIRSVDRACELLAAFTLDAPALALSELSRQVGLPKATVHRIASALLSRGMLAQSADGRYRLGVKVLELGAVVRESLNAVQICRPVMAALAARTSETVLLATADWPALELLIVQRLESPHPLSVGSPVGRRLPLSPGSVVSKALLAGLPPLEAEGLVARLPMTPSTRRTILGRDELLADIERARRQGFAFEQGEYYDGVCGVAVPIIYDGSRPLASIGIVGPETRIASEMKALGELLVEETKAMRPVRLPESGATVGAEELSAPGGRSGHEHAPGGRSGQRRARARSDGQMRG